MVRRSNSKLRSWKHQTNAKLPPQTESWYLIPFRFYGHLKIGRICYPTLYLKTALFVLKVAIFRLKMISQIYSGSIRTKRDKWRSVLHWIIEGLEEAYQTSEEARSAARQISHYSHYITVVHYFSGDSCFVESGTCRDDWNLSLISIPTTSSWINIIFPAFRPSPKSPRKTAL